MEEKHLREFTRLQDEALARLRAGVDRKGYVCQLRAIAMTSVEDSVAYQILLPARSSNVSGADAMPAVAAMTVWKRSVDTEKFRTPVVRLKHGFDPLQPTMEETQVGIPLETVTKLLSKAGTVTVPVHIPEHSWGVDGTSYELMVGRVFVQGRFNWWCDAPRGWEPLADLFDEIATLVKSAVGAGR